MPPYATSVYIPYIYIYLSIYTASHTIAKLLKLDNIIYAYAF